MKTKVLVLGAAGGIAQHVVEFLHNDKNIELTLFARHASQLSKYASTAKIIEGDIANPELLSEAIKGQDIVYANLSGPVDKMAKEFVKVMGKENVKRLIFVTALGVYNEVPGKFGEWNNRIIGSDLVRYGKATKIIEDSKLDYTVVRPSWLTNNDEVDFETTQKGEPFIGTEVSRKAVAAYITEVIMNPTKDSKASVGVNKPGVYGDKPNFY